jgi:hypothetical protein
MIAFGIAASPRNDRSGARSRHRQAMAQQQLPLTPHDGKSCRWRPIRCTPWRRQGPMQIGPNSRCAIFTTFFKITRTRGCHDNANGNIERSQTCWNRRMAMLLRRKPSSASPKRAQTINPSRSSSGPRSSQRSRRSDHKNRGKSHEILIRCTCLSHAGRPCDVRSPPTLSVQLSLRRLIRILHGTKRPSGASANARGGRACRRQRAMPRWFLEFQRKSSGNMLVARRCRTLALTLQIRRVAEGPEQGQYDRLVRGDGT